MAFGTLEDLEGSFDLVIFERVFLEHAKLLQRAKLGVEEGARPIPLVVRGKLEAGDPPKLLVNDVIELEFFCGPDAENLERRVGELGEAAPMPEEAGLRILRHLTTHLRHEQFRDQDCLTVVVDSRPLA